MAGHRHAPAISAQLFQKFTDTKKQPENFENQIKWQKPWQAQSSNSSCSPDFSPALKWVKYSGCIAFPSKHFLQKDPEHDVAAKHESLIGLPGTTCAFSLSKFTLQTSRLSWLSSRWLVDNFVRNYTLQPLGACIVPSQPCFWTGRGSCSGNADWWKVGRH